MMKSLIVSAVCGLSLVATSFAQETPSDRGLSALPSGTYKMDKGHGYVLLSYNHLGFSNPVIGFNDIDASVEFNSDNVTSSTLNVAIDPASIDTNVEAFDSHLKSSDFFDVEKFDTISFDSTEINLTTDYSGTLTGNLTIKGITKPVVLDVVLNKAGQHPRSGADMFGITATGQVDRTEFDLGIAAPYVGAEVDIRVEAEFAAE